MSSGVVWLCVILGLGTGVVRRRSAAVALMALQSLLIGLAALGLGSGEGHAEPLAGVALVAKAVLVAGLLGYAVSRTRQPRPIGDDAAPVLNGLVMVGAVAAAIALIPDAGGASRTAMHGGLALLAIGIVMAAMRRPTLFQLMGLLTIENGVAIVALGGERGLPAVVELGVIFDLAIVVAVAVTFQSRILGAFGTTDAEAMRGLRD
ncbi:MAG: hypothetical protein IT200_10750 [Thermoleophilia bacterium]|nr:hypothetical protein [Thermoleophilia bacterium]